jgi:IS4 transposase
MGRLARSLRQEAKELVRLIDGSPISLKDQRFTWAEADSRCRGLKLHMVYDPRAIRPVHFAVESPKLSEIKVARRVPLDAGITYVFDKGYADYAWWQKIVDARALFVTRLKSNARRRVERDNAVAGANILTDRRVKIGHKQPRGGATNPLYDTELREVIVTRDGKDPLHLVTNDHQRTAQEIADLYKERWQIELFFKWIKQNLKIKSFFGRSENAVRIQIYAAMIAFCLLRIFQNTFAKSHKAGANPDFSNKVGASGFKI